MQQYSMGISPCPNDTFIFGALVQKLIPLPHEYCVKLADVEELNAHAAQATLDITKLSIAAMPLVLENYILLRAGGALGRGCGPVLVARKDVPLESLAESTIAIPGRMTTANLLLSLHGMHNGPRPEMVFDEVMPAVAGGKVDAGVVIHEGRFTYEAHGLVKLLDLGAWWESSTGMPLPLGGIAVKRSLGPEVALQVEKAIRQSLEFAWKHPEVLREYIRNHAQEMDDAVIDSHIATFVNDYSMSLGAEGMEAIRTLITKGAEVAGLTLPDAPMFIEG
ncbi:1,4-dihydroxy-6-naphthoate synthase [Oleidesulfovibrio sp.]|uniref:1,4-dihydroxy-6-naphthoate synthase n=1 Tax=Oleidesulfovibrio sp. TaxID=2909707 RepID=UPI003A8565E5